MIYLIIATILFAFSFGLIKSQLNALPSEFVVFVRLSIAGFLFLPLFKVNKKIFKAGFIGIIQFGIMYLCFIKSFNFLQGNEVAVLTTTTPIFVGLFSILAGEKFNPLYIICIFMSVIGAIIVICQNLTVPSLIKAVLLMETSNCSFAFGQVLWKKYVNDDKLIAIAYFAAALFVIPFLFGINWDISLNTNQTFALLYLGIVPTGIGFWLWNKGASYTSYQILAVMNNLKIPLGVLFSLLIFNEYINIPNFLIGTSLIIIATAILQKFK